MSVLCSFDVAGRRRSPATTAEFHLGRAPGNKGMSYPADPPRVEEIVAVMRQAGVPTTSPRRRTLSVSRRAVSGGDRACDDAADDRPVSSEDGVCGRFRALGRPERLDRRNAKR